jgi:hypothetical protein|tara:strand:+ start:2035 stop:2256 length:222 start_codon:yes stop_codon:yes gene_type:complete
MPLPKKSKSLNYYQDKMWKAVEWMWTDGYAHNLTLKEIRGFLIENLEEMIDEMERWEREIGREMTSAQRRKLR